MVGKAIKGHSVCEEAGMKECKDNKKERRDLKKKKNQSKGKKKETEVCDGHMTQK